MPVVVPGPSSATSALQSVATQLVFDYLYDTRGAPIKGAQVTITLGAANATVITPQVELSSVLIRVTTDANGYWSANLIPNANINPLNTTYLIQPPGLDAYSINVPASGGPFQSTSPSVLVNVPGVLAPATTGITGNLTVTGNETVTGTLAVAGVTTLASTTTGALTTAAASIGGDLTILSPFRLLMLAAASKLVPGITSFSVRNNADGADNLLITDAGAATVRNSLTVTAGDTVITAGRLLLNAAAAKIKGGATSLSLRNNADSADNVLISDAGNVTVRGTVTTSTTNFHAEVFRNAALNIPNTGLTTLAFDTIESGGDPNGNFNTSTGLYTCPIAGLYRVTSFSIVSSTPGQGSLVVIKNGVNVKNIGSGYGNIANAEAAGTTKIRTSAGDTLGVQMGQNSTTNPAAIFTGTGNCWAQFEYVGP